MEDSSRDSASGAGPPTSPWNRSPRRSHNDQGAAASSAESSSSPRSQTSRRRRILGRLARSGSDPRSSFNSLTDAYTSSFVPGSILKMPSKRKAPPQSPEKPQQLSSTMDSDNSVSAMDPPLIKADDVVSTKQSLARMNPGSVLREYMDSSDDDMDMIEFPNFAGVGQNFNNHPHPQFNHVFRPQLDLSNRNRVIEEAKRRQEAGRMLSAVLVEGETSTQSPGNLAGSNGGTQRSRYLPLCPSHATSTRFDGNDYNVLTVIPGHQDFSQRSERATAFSNATWPLHELPVEIFDLITTHLARDDVKCMRLVNHEFEQKVSRSLFHTSVVPFNTEIYDMIDEDRKASSRTPVQRPKGKGKTKATASDQQDSLFGLEPGGLQWQNAKEDKEGKVYKGHGLRVFQGFGPHIKRFGMSFEISEKQLFRPPTKKELDHVESYHGSYDWPSINYARFASLAGLENTADETSRMKAAFANLEIVQELALSVDSGLGWLNGPDKSLRALLFEQSTPVFGSSYDTPDHATQAATDFWTALLQSQRGFDPHASLRESTLEFRSLPGRALELPGLRGNLYSYTHLWSAIDRNKLSRALDVTPSGFGVLYTTSGQPPSDVKHKFSLMPGDLTKEQKEWLLETQWAQQAFLESYMLAVIDNPATFENVSTLNIAKLSSRFLPMLSRDVFWEALPNLFEVTLRVSADWRTVEKDDAGFAQTINKFPSEAARMFHRDVLQARVAPKRSIKKLCIGWVGGGERAEGMFARNSNLLPAPVTKPDHCTANSTIFGIIFEHVEHLILTNCWITPPTLEGLVKSHASKALKKLTLDSVSLTTHPKFPSNIQGAGAQQFAQAMAAVQAQLANNAPMGAQPPAPGAVFGNQGHQQAMNPQQVALMQQQLNQQWTQQLQQMQQQPNVNGAGNAVPNTATNATGAAQTNLHWTSGFREGSWPQLLNEISPGTVFNDYLPAPAPWEEQLPPRPETNLRTIEFKSCGYAKLPNHTGFDQLAMEAAAGRSNMSAWFRTRWGILKSAMMTTNDRNIGQIVQHLPYRELDGLRFAWGLTEGGPQDWVNAEDAEFDGYFIGGTGRFSGVVEKGMALVGQPDA